MMCRAESAYGSDTMQTVTAAQRAPEVAREQTLAAELVTRLASAVRIDGHAQPVPGLHLYRASVPAEPLHGVITPSLCVIAQGSKEVLVGASQYRYDPAHYLLATMDLPHISHICDASAERPYLSLRLELDPALVGSVMTVVGQRTSPGPQAARAMAVSPLTMELLEPVVRLVRLLDTPADVPVVWPLVTREIVYRLLQGEHGDRLRQLALRGGYTARIARAVEHLRRDFDQPLRVEPLARELGMSVSAFYQHFKDVTALSPVQFQKRLRLQEARRLMLSEDLDATRAAFRVGYHDAAHFSREYKSMFGAPPLRDVAQLRAAAMESAAPGERIAPVPVVHP
jgi:AraC-like DNA-binding protein